MSNDPSFGGLIVDSTRLQEWFDATVPGMPGPIRLEVVKGGASNILFRVTRGTETYALRRPPKAANDPTSNNMSREIRLLEALGKSNIRHARMVASSVDAAIIGVPFVVMVWIDGFTPYDPMPGVFATAPEQRRALGFEVVEALADVANADWRALGLEGFGKPDRFLERQVDRWLGQLERYHTREIPHLSALADWLRQTMPATQRIGLMHGDYSFANVMIAPEPPARLAAIVDWENSTIGDPLIDLGHLLSGWEDNESGPTWMGSVKWRLGFASRREIAARYGEKTGLSVDRIDFYMALALFKLGIIMEGAYARYASGKSDHPSHKAMETAVPGMIAQAARIAAIA